MSAEPPPIPEDGATYTCDFCGRTEGWMAVEDEDSEWEYIADKTWCGKCTRLAVLDIGERL